MTLVGQVLMFFHVASAVAWMGGALLIAAVLFPTLWKMGSEERGRFYAKIMPLLGPYMLFSSVLTLLFGGLLAYRLNGGDLAAFFAPWSASSWGSWVSFGAVFGLAAFLVGEVYILPTAMRLERFVTKALASPEGARWAEIDLLGRKLDRVATASLALFVLALIGMAGAASV